MCFKGSMGRGEGDKLHSAHCCQFAPHLQEGEVAVHVALSTRRAEGKSLGAQSAHLHSAGLEDALSGISKANPRQFLTSAVRFTE